MSGSVHYIIVLLRAGLGSVNHMMQEEPLPHELRPISILKMTMDYLVTMVMDDGQDRPADWYDFVWNRTRAIRKVCWPLDGTCRHLIHISITLRTSQYNT